MKCTCGLEVTLVGGEVIYPHRKDLYHKKFWLCKPCDAYVGCHGDTNRPLGTPANAELRIERSTIHRAFDPIWKEGHVSRSDAYKMLRENMHMTAEQCHIGLFTLEDCAKALKILDNWWLT